MLRLSLFVRILLCFATLLLPLGAFDQWLYDHFFWLRGKQEVTAPILLVRVSDARLYPYLVEGKAWPPHFSFSSRPYAIWYPQFYEVLAQKVQSASPRLTVFTSFFEAVDDTTQRPKFLPQVLHSSFISDDAKVVPPLTVLSSDTNYGFNNIFPDTDNVVRQTPLVYSSGASLALRSYHRLKTEPIKRNLLDPLRIDFHGPEGTFPSITDSELFAVGSRVDAMLRDKIVLVGRDGGPASLMDTPFGKMSRLEIQANILSTFLENHEIGVAPSWLTSLISLVAVLIAITAILSFSLSGGWIFVLVFSLALLMASLIVFSQLKLWIPIGGPIVCALGSYAILLGHHLRRQEEQQWRLEQDAENLRQMDQFKSNFISLFSHDLKTPIAKIKAITERLLTDNPHLAQSVLEGLRSIDQTNTELARYISDILKVNKMESKAIQPRREVIDLNRLVESAVDQLKFAASGKGIKLTLDLEPLFSMEGDPQLIQEVIANLVENAIKYSPNETEVRIRTWEQNEKAYVRVQDQGCGIPADELPQVTAKFFRGHLTAEKTKGSGLGLYLARYFVELHGGALELASEVGKGTSVQFGLPLQA